jgi:hypothetical protein
MISVDDIDALQYAFPQEDDTIILKNLDTSQIGLIMSFHAFIFHKDVKGEIIDRHEKWMQLQLEEFQRFRSSKEWFSISNNSGQAYAPSGGNHGKDLVAEFKKGIKRDTNMFPSLRQDKQWDHWQRAVFAQARTQDLSHALDPKFSPVGIKGSNLFAKKQKFMYAVFERTLLSNKGKALVRLHLNDYNAQKSYTALCEYSLQSTFNIPILF